MNKISIEEHFALLDELEISYNLIIKGLKEIQNFNDYDKFYFLPLQLLSQGIERFLKSYFCLYYFMENNSFPKIDTLRSFSHDINQPIKLILEKYFKSYDREQYKLDLAFINHNQNLKEFLNILSYFGSGKGRYYNFNIITGNKTQNNYVIEQFKIFENTLMKQNNLYFEMFDEKHNQVVNEFVIKEIVKIVEKFVCAISRQFIFNNYNFELTPFVLNNFLSFGMMHEGDFGKNKY